MSYGSNGRNNGFIPLNEDDADSVTRLLYFDLETVADDDLDMT